MKQTFLSIFIICSILLTGSITACNPDNTDPPTEKPPTSDNSGNNNNENNGNNNGNNENENNNNMQIQIKIGSNTYTAALTDNSTAVAFKAMLPLTLNMEDVNQNEKFIQLANSLPTAPSNPGTIHSGDIMLYGSAGLVLFYKSFSTSYSYTRIGAIENPTSLESVVGPGNVTIIFENIKEE